MLSVIMLSIIMLSVIMLSEIMLSVIKLSLLLQNVVSPLEELHKQNDPQNIRFLKSNVVSISSVLLSLSSYAECLYDSCLKAECRYA